jgi:IS30 family transposase
MGHCHDNNRDPPYKQLSFEERTKIETRLKHGASCKDIAEDLGRSKPTIYRKIANGSCKQTVNGKEKSAYFAEFGQSRHEAARERSAGKSKIEGAHAFVEYADKSIGK